MNKFTSAMVIIALTGLYFFSGLADVDPGEVGIKVKKIGANKGMQDDTLDTGLHWVEPFKYDVITYDVKIHQYDVQDLPAQSKDGQPISVDASLEIGLSDNLVPQLHEQVGRDWFERLIYPAMRSTVRNKTSEHLSDAIYTAKGRNAIQLAVEEVLIAKAAPYGINIRVNLRALEFTNNDFIKTLENKAKEAQNVIIATRQAERAEQDAIKVANIAEGEKQKSIKQAEAEREKLRLEGEGQRLKDEEIAKGNLALKQAEAEGSRLQVEAFGDGATYASVRWAEMLGPNVKVLGYPLGAPGTTGLFNVDGVLGQALKVKGAQNVTQ